MPSSTATNVAGPTGRLVGPTSRLAGPTQPAPETNSILEFRASCFAHLAFASSPHPATFLHTSRVSCVLHLLHPVQRVRGPPSGSDPNSRIHCTHSTNSTPSSPFPLLCCLCACFVSAVSGATTPAIAVQVEDTLPAANSNHSYIVACSGDTFRSSRQWTTPQVLLPASQQERMLHGMPPGSLLWLDARRGGAWSSPAWTTPSTALFGLTRTTPLVPRPVSQCWLHGMRETRLSRTTPSVLCPASQLLWRGELKSSTPPSWRLSLLLAAKTSSYYPPPHPPSTLPSLPTDSPIPPSCIPNPSNLPPSRPPTPPSLSSESCLLSPHPSSLSSTFSPPPSQVPSLLPPTHPGRAPRAGAASPGPGRRSGLSRPGRLPFPHFPPSPTSRAGQRASRARHRHNEACRYCATGVASGGAVVSSSCCCPPFSPLAERRAFRACYQRQGRTSHPPPLPTTTTHTSPPHLTQHFHHHTSCCHFQIQGSPRKRGSSRRGSGSAQPPNTKPCFISPTNLPDGPLAELDTCCLSPRTQELPSEPHDGTINPLRHQQQPTLLEPPWRLA